MKIRLGILDDDANYTKRFSAYLNTHSDQIDLFIFSTWDSFQSFLEQKFVDVLLAEPKLVPERETFPKNMQAAYFSATQDVETIRDLRAVCKYQKAGLLIREVKSLYAELDKGETLKAGGSRTRIIAFRGVSGGVGTTTCAIACARTLAAMRQKVIYLNLEENGCVFPLLAGEGTSTLSDILYAIKSKSANLQLKMESMIRQDPSGVFFYAPFTVVPDAVEMKREDVRALFDTILASGNFGTLIIDTDSCRTAAEQEAMARADQVVLVSDGHEISNIKLRRLVQAMRIADDTSGTRILGYTTILYNRYGKISKDAVTEPRIGIFGHIQEAEGASAQQAVVEAQRQGGFARLLAQG